MAASFAILATYMFYFNRWVAVFNLHEAFKLTFAQFSTFWIIFDSNFLGQYLNLSIHQYEIDLCIQLMECHFLIVSLLHEGSNLKIIWSLIRNTLYLQLIDAIERDLSAFS